VLAGLEPWQAMKCLAVFSCFLGGAIAYAGLRGYIGRRAALWGAILFQASPLFLFLFSHHAALPWQFSFPAAAALLFLSLPPGRRDRRLALSMAAAALALAHVLMAFMVLLCIGLIWFVRVVRARISLWTLAVEWMIPAALGIGVFVFHLVPAVAARTLLAPNLEVDPVYLNWKNSFVFPTFTSAMYGTRWLTVQATLPALYALGLATSVVALWMTRARRGDVWRLAASLCAIAALGFLFGSELAYPLYSVAKPFQALQWPYRFAAVAAIGATLALPLALTSCVDAGVGRNWCRGSGLVVSAAFLILLVALYAQLLREGSSPHLSPASLQGEFRQAGHEFATIGPHWRDYVQQGGLAAHCANANARCEPTFSSTQKRRWSIDAKESTQLVVPMFAFAGWTVRVDGVGIPFSIDPGTGLIAIPVPAGAHRLEVELTGLPAARVGTLVSIVSSAALVLVLIAGRRRRAFCHRQGAERPFVRWH
jgi:hypothetical protein